MYFNAIKWKKILQVVFVLQCWVLSAGNEDLCDQPNHSSDTSSLMVGPGCSQSRITMPLTLVLVVALVVTIKRTR